MKLTIFGLTILTLINNVFSLPPDPELYANLTKLINPNGITNVGAVIAEIPDSSHGLVILSPSNAQDFDYYTLNGTTAACDSQYSLSGGPGPALRQSGTCISQQDVSFLVDCSNSTNTKNEKNWLYVTFNSSGTFFATYGDAKAIFVPRQIGTPPPPPSAGGNFGKVGTTEKNVTNGQLIQNIPTLNWTDSGFSTDENTIVLSDCPTFIKLTDGTAGLVKRK